MQEQIAEGFYTWQSLGTLAGAAGAGVVVRDGNVPGGVAGLGPPAREPAFPDVAVGVAVGPVAEVAVAQLFSEQGNDPILRGALGLSDGRHHYPLNSLKLTLYL